MNALTIEKSQMKDVGLVLLASLMICLSGSISIPLWFTPVPLATQSAVILLMSSLLGSKKGFLATLTFLVFGAMGLPVFSAGSIGILTFIGPKGGYIFGYLIASFVTGYLVEKKFNPYVFFSLGSFVIYLFGAGYLATFVGVKSALFLGVAPFLFGDFLKIIICTKIFKWTKNIA